jgi:hypothetical protein
MTQENRTGIRTFTSGEALEAYRRVKLDSSGNVVYADADDVGIGITEEAVAITTPVAVRMHGHPGTRKMVCSAAVAAYATVYGTDDGKVDDAAGGGPAIGVALAAGSANLSVIEVLPATELGGLIHAAVADSTDVENTVTETAFSTGSKTIDGAKLRAGDVIEVIARAYVLDNNGADTLTVKLYAGTEEIVTTGAVDSADADIVYIHAFITVRIAGSGGHVSASGVVANGVEGTVTAKPFRKDDAAEDLSGDVAIAVKATWSAAHADNEVYLEDFIVILHRQ